MRLALEASGNRKIDALVTEAAKSREKTFRELAQLMGLPGLGVTQSDLEQMITPTQSQRIQDKFGTGSLAEAAALAAAGPDAQLLAPRVVSGDGPGAPDLITLRGRDLIAACPVCLYAGSLVPEALLSHCPEGAKIINTARMSLDEIMAEIATAHAAGHDIARLHSGDLSVWSAMGEQLRRLRGLDIPYDVTPGVPSFAAAAAALNAELTLPGAMPEGEALENFARTGATLAIHLSVHVLEKVIAELTPHYGTDCPVAVVWRASWPDQRVVKATLETLQTAIGAEMERTALILVGHAIGAEDFGESRLYAGDYDRRFRPVGTDPRFPETAT
ncbi:Precorrin-4 C(11)-methyltransferase [Nymphon striatum]|nr:Precorrin-4 C(11)-methyltransferase [Nymphon striatum]